MDVPPPSCRSVHLEINLSTPRHSSFHLDGGMLTIWKFDFPCGGDEQVDVDIDGLRGFIDRRRPNVSAQYAHRSSEIWRTATDCDRIL